MTAPEDIVARMVAASTQVWQSWPESIDAGNVDKVKIAAMTAAANIAAAEITRLRTEAAQARAAGREDAARWHEAEAASLRAFEAMNREAGGWPDTSRLSRITEHGRAAAAIRALEDQGGGDAD